MRLRPALPLLAIGIAGMALLCAWPPLRAGLLETGRLLYLLSYAAGLTPMRLLPFLVATAIGMASATFLMAAVGDLGGGSLDTLVGAALGIATLSPSAERRPNAPQPRSK